MVHLLWRTVWRFLKKLELQNDPTILPLGIHPKNVQGKNRDSDVENELVDPVGEGEGGKN